jgi:Gluconate 2-dehydrogenase subunit 3
MPDKPLNETPESTGVSRRNLFHILGSVPLAAAVADAAMPAGHAHMAHAGASVTNLPFERKVFDDHQWKQVHVLCDLVLPADEKSGSATQAGVPEFMDDWLAFRTEQDGNDKLKAEIFGGLMWLDRESRELFSKDFADASPEQQKQLLDRIAWPERAAREDKIWAAFFGEFRDLTVSGFFSSKMGVADLPYLGNTAVAHWQGCEPKVWAVIEERMKNGYQGLVKPKPKSSNT